MPQDNMSEDQHLTLTAMSGDEVDFMCDGDLYLSITDEDRCVSVYLRAELAVQLRAWLMRNFP